MSGEETEPARPLFYTATEVARMFGVKSRTVARWGADGRFNAVRTPGGHYRFPAVQVEKNRDDPQIDSQPLVRGVLPETGQPVPASLEAGLFHRPGVKRYHAVIRLSAGTPLAACTLTPLINDTVIPARQVKPMEYCRRDGCMRRWVGSDGPTRLYEPDQ